MIHAGPTGRRGRGGGTDTPGFTRGYFHVLPTGERRAYIADQKAHHRKRDFQAEFLAILKQHGIEYDPRYVWG